MASHSEISINPFYFSDEQLDILFRDCPIRTLKRHEYVHQSGDLVQTICRVLTGRLRVYSLQENGKERTHHFHYPRTLIGNIDSFSERPANTFCEVLEDCTLAVCPVDLFYARLEEAGLMRLYITLEARKAQYNLLREGLLGNLLQETSVEQLLHEGLSQQEIADFLGVSRMQVSRVIKQLRERRQ